MKLPRIVVNAKVYPEAGGPTLDALAQACRQVGRDNETGVVLAPPLVELARLGADPGLKGLLYAQHVDALEPGIGTGFTTVEAIRAAGAAGAILNHAEHKLDAKVLERTIARLRQSGLASLVCADSLAEARKVANFAPDIIAIEPPELIGGSISVTSADPGIVSGAVHAVHAVNPKIAVLCGAGVKTSTDLRKAIDLGAHGVLLASGVVKAKDPAGALRELASGLH